MDKQHVCVGHPEAWLASLHMQARAVDSLYLYPRKPPRLVLLLHIYFINHFASNYSLLNNRLYKQRQLDPISIPVLECQCALIDRWPWR